MTYQLLLIDMDSTLINEEAIDLLAEYAGVGVEVAEITDRAMRGEIGFHEALKERVALLANQELSILEKVRKRLTFTTGLQQLITGLRSRGMRIGVVSGGFHEIIDPFVSHLELDFVRANHFEVTSNRLTGRVSEPIIGAAEKARALEDFARQFDVPMGACVAVGDGANDIEMLQLAGLGISFCGKAALREVADININQRDLSLIMDYI